MTTATLYEIRQGAAWITLNRPENRNALSAQLVNELDAHLIAAIADPAVRCIVLTGSGPAFCAGADLKSPPGQMIEGRQGISLPQVLTRMMDSERQAFSPMLAILSAQHETQYSRLFRS